MMHGSPGSIHGGSDRSNPSSRNGWLPVALGLIILPVFATRRMRKALEKLSLTGRALTIITLLGIQACLGVTGLTGCGGSGFFGIAPHTYTITVTATGTPIGGAQSETHSATVLLTVQ